MLLLGLMAYFVLIFSLTLHEAAHALAAKRVGDESVYLGGPVTLSPLPHILREPFGLVVAPLLSFFFWGGHGMMGWASEPYDPIWAREHPRRAATMALAGPLAHLLLVVAAGVLIHFGLAADVFVVPELFSFQQVVVAKSAGAPSAFATLLSLLFSLNLLLFCLNMIPVPPLDGSSALGVLLPERRAVALQEWMARPLFSMFGILAAWLLAHPLFYVAFSLALPLLYPGNF